MNPGVRWLNIEFMKPMPSKKSARTAKPVQRPQAQSPQAAPIVVKIL